VEHVEAMAGKASKKTRPKSRVSRSKRRLRLLWAVALLGLVSYLYYHPLSSYLETRGELSAQRAHVESLRITKAELELRLVNATSLEATQREARRIGFVLPTEQLFVVKGIPEWRRAARNLREDG
jgi:Septum formation initiator